MPVSKEEFQALLGHAAPPNLIPKKGQYNLNTPLSDMKGSIIASLLHKFLLGQSKKLTQGQEGTPTALLMGAILQEMPLRSLFMYAEAGINREVLDAGLQMINGSFFKGMSALLKALWAK